MKTDKIKPILAIGVLFVAVMSWTVGPQPTLAQEGLSEKPAANPDVQPGAGDPAKPAPEGRVQVALTADQILVNGQATTLDGFAAAMKAAAGGAPQNAAVSFKCAGEVPVSRVYEVQQQMQSLGMKKVMYGGKDGGKVPMALPSPQAMAKLQSLPAADIMALKVRAGRQVSVDGTDTPPAKVGEMVRRRVVENPKLVISLTMAPDTTFKELVNVLEQLQSVGAERIAMNEPAM